MEASAPVSMVEEYVRVLRRHLRLILLCAVAGALLGLLLGVATLPLYRTRTSLDIRSLNGDFLNSRSVSATGEDGGAPDTNLQTQIRLLESDTLIGATNDQMLGKPHVASIPRRDLLSRLLVGLHLRRSESIPYTALVDDAAQRIKVKPLGMTRLVEITCDAYDRDFAATYCNTLTRTFEEQDLATRAAEAQKTQDWLTRQVADIRERAQDSQRRLEAAVGGNGLMLSQTTTSPGEERLRALEDEYTKAQADRMRQQADSGVASTAPLDTVPGVQDNPEHRAYALRLAELRGQLAALMPPLTEQNPKVIHVRAQMAEAEAGLRTTATTSSSRQSNEFYAARHREDLLRIAMESQKATVSSDLQKAAQVSLLRRELESEQQLYQTLLQRAKEAGFASALQAATVRVVDPARPAVAPIAPRRGLAGAAGLLLGSVFGVGFSLFRDRNTRVFRGPGEVQRFLHVHELGVIPATRRLGRGAPLPGEYGNAVALTRWSDDFSITAEAYRNATLSVLLADSSKRARSYVVSSPNAGEGKTTVTSNLGIGLSKSRLRVVLIDGDLRRPALHRAFRLENTFGLRNVLRGEIDLHTAPTEVLAQSTAIPNVAMMPAGTGSEDAVELLHSPHFGALLARLSRDFDVVLIDTPPALHMADARILAGSTDGTILVLRAGLTTREEAANARDLFDRDGAHLVGIILNDFDPEREGTKNYYRSYYTYQSGREDDVAAEARA